MLLPLRDNAGVPFSDQLWSTLKDTLTARFGGVTAYTRAPAEGAWQAAGGRAGAEDVFVVEVMVRVLEETWWRTLRRDLERLLRQDEIVMRAVPYRTL